MRMSRRQNRIVVDLDHLVQFHRDVAKAVVEYCCHRFNLRGITVTVNLNRIQDCWGESWVMEGDRCYGMRICTEQTLRDYVATIVHEMIHVNQWETDEWEGDGEDEAYANQFVMTDELWADGIL